MAKDDLVKRLRSWSGGNRAETPQAECHEAADEIERLKHIEDSIDALFDLGQGHLAGSIELPMALWNTIRG